MTIFQWPREPNVKGDWNKKGVRVKGKNAVCRNGPPLSNQTNGVRVRIDLISHSTVFGVFNILYRVTYLFDENLSLA